MIEDFLKKKLSYSSKRKLRNLAQNLIKIIPIGLDLNKLGRIYGTDKIGGHSYTTHYMTHLNKFKYKRINLLEIGVGGTKTHILEGNP